MEKLAIPSILIFCVFFGSLGEYVCGRIILPEVGLTAPEYWTWFWLMFWVFAFSSPFWLIKAMLD